MKYVLIILTILLTVSQAQNRDARKERINISLLGFQGIRWEKEVVLYFDTNFPEPVAKIFNEQVKELNEILGAKVISTKYCSVSCPSNISRDGVNLILWNGTSFLKPQEQARTSVNWIGGAGSEVDIGFNPLILENIDLGTLIRHELTHVVGIGHVHERTNHLMEESLPPFTVRYFDTKMLEGLPQIWEEESSGQASFSSTK